MKHLINGLLSCGIIVFVLFTSCVKVDQLPAGSTDTSGMKINAPGDFNYTTSEAVNFDISLLTNDDKPLANVLVNVMDKPVEEGGKVLLTALTDGQGKINTSASLPTCLTQVIVDASYIGLLRNAVVSIESKRAYCIIGGHNGYGGNVVAQHREIKGFNNPVLQRVDALTYKYMGSYDNNGKPNYLQPVNDVVSSTLLSFINASLPEGRPVPTYHPAYLNGAAQTNLDIVQRSDVYITFVHEGAGYKNTLAYFTYPTGHPPATTSAIDTLNIVLPNASLNGSGGDLLSGNKVKLGNFAAGTSIGFCLIANGWSDATRLVGSGANKFYSIDALNPESASLQRHTVLLNDATDNLLLIGFEDLRRDQGSDDDFNDIIFYATTSVSSAISVQNVNPIDRPTDTDGDGVTDVYDQFPTDPLRAYINYYPGANVYGAISFEDAWPNTGDYDLNDMIVGYRYKIINNALNKTIEMYADYTLKASGALFRNGFGVQFPFAPSAVSSVTGSRLVGSIISRASNGCEAGQAKAVIIPFDDFKALMPTSNGYVNTVPGFTYMRPDTVHMKVTLTSALTAAQLGTAPFNQFLIKDQNRGVEVHLPGELPTDKANTGLFGTLSDNTIPSQNRYYKTAGNLPFAINFPEDVDYPLEGKPIYNTFLKFVSWAQSGGSSYPDWYKDVTGYRYAGNVYTH